MSEAEQKEKSWRELDENCLDVMSKLVTVETIGVKHSYTEAAAELGVSSSALRQRLYSLEKRLGGPAIDENLDHAPLGKAMSRLWRKVRPSLEIFMDEIRVLKNQRELRLSTIKSVWDSEGDWIEKEYEKRIRGGSIKIQYADSFHIIEHQIRYGEADIGIASFPPKDKDISPPIKFLPWRNEDMVFVCDMWLLATNELPTIPVARVEGIHQTFFTMTDHSSMYEPVNQYLQKNKLKFRYKTPCKSIAEVIEDISNKRGVSILPLHAVEKASLEGKVEYFKLNPKFVRPVGILYRTDALKLELQEALIDVLKTNTQDPDKPKKTLEYFTKLPSTFP